MPSLLGLSISDRTLWTERSALSHLTEPGRKLFPSPILPGDRESPKSPSCTWGNFIFSAPPLQVLGSLANSPKWRGWKRTETRSDYTHGENEFPYLPVREMLSSSNMITKQQSTLLCDYFTIGLILFYLFFLHSALHLNLRKGVFLEANGYHWSPVTPLDS